MEKIFALVSKDTEYNRRLVTKINSSKQIGFVAAGFDSFDSMVNSLGKKEPLVVAFTEDQVENLSYFFTVIMGKFVKTKDKMEIIYLSDTNFKSDSLESLPLDLIERNINVVFRFQKLSVLLEEMFPRQCRISDGTRIVTVFSPDFAADESWVLDNLVKQQKSLYVPMLPFPEGADSGNPGLSDLIYELRNEKECKDKFFEKLQKHRDCEKVRGFACFLDLFQMEDGDITRLMDFLVGLKSYDRIVFFANTITSGIICLFENSDEIILPEKGLAEQSNTDRFLSQLKFAGWHDILSKTVTMEVCG